MPYLNKSTLQHILTIVLTQACFASAAIAADLGGDCCADLEERIAELEATTARKGNRKISVTVSGHVNESLLFWDDGEEDNVYVVNDQNDQSNFAFEGDAGIGSDLRAGYVLRIRLQNSLSGEVSQDDDDTDLNDFLLWESHVFLESRTKGRVTLGLAPRVSDGAPETDLSETGNAAYAGVQDIGGGFALRRSGDGVLSSVSWGDLYSHFNGDTANLIRYDTPELAGFVFSASYGEDDIWDVGATYEGKLEQFALSAAIAYTQSTDENGQFGDDDHSTIVGSIAILHEPTGLNALVSAAQRSFDETLEDADGVFRTPKDQKFIYAKAGWLANLNSLGPTGLYGEYGLFEDFLTAGADTAAVLSIDGSGGLATRIVGNEARVWGFGFVQHIEAASIQIYLGYRHHEAEFDLVDAAGNSVAQARLDGFDTVIVGSDISF